MVGRSLHINNFNEACLVLPRPFPGLFSAKSRHEFCSGVFTLAGCCNRDSKGMIAGTRAKNLGRGLTEVEGNEDLMAAQGHSHRYARDGLWFRKGVCPTRSSPDAPLILLALSIRIETAVVPRPGSMRPHWTMPPHPRDMYTSMRVPSAHQSSIILHVACLTLSRCALVLELLVVEVAGVGARHVESVPITPCRAVRSRTFDDRDICEAPGFISGESCQPYQKTLPMANPRPKTVVSLRQYSTQDGLASSR